MCTRLLLLCVAGFWLCFLLVFFNAKNSESHTKVLFVRHTRALCERRVARSAVDIAIQSRKLLLVTCGF